MKMLCSARMMALAAASVVVMVVAVCCPMAVQAQTSVAVEMDATWDSTPLYMEAAELLGDVSEQHFWSFVDAFAQAGAVKHDQDGYERALSITEDLLSASSVDAVKLSLSARTKSPKVAMFFQIGQDDSALLSANDNCEAVAVVGQSATCSAADLSAIISTASDPPSTVYDVDHIRPSSSRNDVPVVVLYADIGSPSFKDWHEALSQLCQEGKVQYVLRHLQRTPASRMRLVGWGAELAIKKTEYTVMDDAAVQDDDATTAAVDDSEDEVAGFSFTTLRRLYPDKTDDLDAFRSVLLNNTAVIKDLKAWELQDISFQAAQRVMTAKEPVGMLQRVSQNFPSIAHTLVGVKVGDAFRKEVETNQRSMQQFGISPGTSALIVDGVYTDVTSNTNLFSLLKVIQSESDTLGSLQQLGTDADTAHAINSLLASHQAPATPKRVDVRSSAVKYMNNLEKDSMYSRWASSLVTLLRPGPPPHQRHVARNMYTLTAVINPARAEDRALLSALHHEVFENKLPVRVGVVFATSQGQAAITARVPAFEPYSSTEKVNGDLDEDSVPTAGVLVARAFEYVKRKGSNIKAFAFLTALFKAMADSVAGDGGDGELVDVLREAFVAQYDMSTWEKLLPASTTYDKTRKKMDVFVHKLGLGDNAEPVVLFNGEPLTPGQPDEVLSQVHTAMTSTLPAIQRAVYYGWLSDHSDVLDFFMKQGVSSRVLPSLLTSPSHLHVAQPADPEHPADKLLAHVAYTTKPETHPSVKPMTYWLVVDLDTRDGQLSAFELLRRQLSTSKLRVAILHGGARDTPGQQLETYLQAVARYVPASKALGVAGKVLERVLAGDAVSNALGQTVVGVKAWADVMAKVKEDEDSFSSLLASKRSMIEAFGLPPAATTVILNGHVFGPMTDRALRAADYHQLDKRHGDSINTRAIVRHIDQTQLATPPAYAAGSGDDDARALQYRNDVVVGVCAVLSRSRMRAAESAEQGQQVRRVDLSLFKGLDTTHSALELTSALVGQSGRTPHQVYAIVDPASDGGQRMGPALSLLMQHTAVHITLLLNPTPRVSEMPVKRFYRAVMPAITFSDDGTLDPGPRAVFANLPRASLLTLGLETPASWMVKSVESKHDLDNIHLQSSQRGVHAVFELEHMAVEGSCVEATTRRPTAGLQLELGTRTHGSMYDTLVMANLGYFQLKATPGAWQLSLREGRSSDIFALSRVKGADSHSPHDAPVILVHDLSGTFVSVSVERRPGMEAAKLLEDSSAIGLWESIKRLVPGSKQSKEKQQQQEQTSNDDMYRCVVQRPKEASYLYFMTFRLEMSGVDSIQSVEIRDNNELLGDDQYNLSDLTVSASDNFSNALASIAVIAS
ncbi:hypothetical protein PTSG_07405 [Salpingoeca rosetta]|uniref:UDP-glucose:glycoprotein glucosyltransferase n=1 Tax=Salpingoeca rosetta (strain ATCC 50818 / BSB-021) TaxID=946362 RepID=F2UIL6_SALR5|nr:uncharacterized protein PTSG_07405 [Salpingoeca rosetta]EGD77065.1 hypothetical protein PTSG_07405 [Salpingoeca rosetta]|eukprot:XP_004990905.1 hypothetical protein PTSG_07405 [Salpingoeca rosetta]